MFCEKCGSKLEFFGVTDKGVYKYCCPKCYKIYFITKEEIDKHD
jgi:hypothetical protein